LRAAIKAFREKGKKAVAYTDTLGEFGQGNGAYYLACAFDEIYIQPSGNIGLDRFDC
jgi:protease IV